jgi:hypothetical protein
MAFGDAGIVQSGRVYHAYASLDLVMASDLALELVDLATLFPGEWADVRYTPPASLSSRSSMNPPWYP